MQIETRVQLFRRTFIIFYTTEDYIILAEKNHNLRLFKSDGLKIDKNSIIEDRTLNCKRVKLIVSALFLKPFLEVCTHSKVFRRNIISNICELSTIKCENAVFKLILEQPDKEILDYAWNEKLLFLLCSRIEIENAFAWLSTLGGAYSALGDYFEHCAEEAGRISIRQYRLSQMLGDDSLAARSKLYSALAFSQKGYLKLSSQIVRGVAKFARSTNDKRLNRMCQGVWAKLKYLRQLKELNDKCKISNENK